MKNRSVIIGIVVVVVLAIASIYLWSTSGYGKVSDDAYEVAKSLYGICMVESEERLEAVSQMMSEDSDKPLDLSDSERSWLESMIQAAKGGDWKGAAKSARRMMEDQVDR